MSLLQRERNEDGASAVEYGLLVAGIAALIVLVVFALGNVVSSTFNKTCGALSAGSAATSTSTCQ